MHLRMINHRLFIDDLIIPTEIDSTSKWMKLIMNDQCLLYKILTEIDST